MLECVLHVLRFSVVAAASTSCEITEPYLLVCIIQYTVVFLYSTDQSFSMKIIIIDTAVLSTERIVLTLKKRQYNYKS